MAAYLAAISPGEQIRRPPALKGAKGVVSPRSPWGIVLAVAGLVLVTGILFNYVAPFVLAMLIAVLLDPLVERVEQRLNWGRGGAVLVVVGAAAALFLPAALWAFGHLSRELSSLVQRLPDMARQAYEWAAFLVPLLEEHLQQVPDPFDDVLRRGLSGLVDAGVDQLQHALAVLGRVPQWFLLIAVSGLTAYFLVRDKHVFAKGLFALLPPEGQRQARRMFRRVVGGAVGFVRVQVVLTVLTGAFSVGVFTALGIPYPWVLGITAALFDFLPLFGSGAVYIPLVLGYLAFHRVGESISLLVAWGVLVAMRQIVEPRLIGSQMGLHPVTALIAVYLGFHLVGVVGLMLGPLAAVLFKAALEGLPPSRCQR